MRTQPQNGFRIVIHIGRDCCRRDASRPEIGYCRLSGGVFVLATGEDAQHCDAINGASSGSVRGCKLDNASGCEFYGVAAKMLAAYPDAMV